LFYVMVAERGSTKRLHLHVLGGQELIGQLASNWEKHGIVEVDTVPLKDLGRVSEYMSKGFSNPDRLFSRRYTALRGSKPTVEYSEVSSHEEGIQIVASISECSPRECRDEMNLPYGHLTKMLWSPC
jgi:hypothetical protein